MKIDELRARLSEIQERMQEIDNEHAGQALPEELRVEFEGLKDEREDTERLISELETRAAWIAEGATDERRSEAGAGFETRRPTSTRGDDIYDLSTIRMSVASPEEGVRQLRDRAMRSVETATFPHQIDADEARSQIERLIERHDDPENVNSVPGEVSRRILLTGSPKYRRAFRKALAGDDGEARALSVGTGSAGGFAVVYTLDPTIIPTSNLSVNPFRALARVETIAGTNEWRGVTSSGVTAAYHGESVEMTDNSPAMAQPAVVVQRADCYIQFSYELDQDWGSLQSEMAGLIQDAKDDLEASAFTTGNGTPPNPQGLITGATTTVTAGGVAGFAIADLYKVEEALGPRFRPRAAMVANRFVANKVRQFDTAGGSGVWSLDPLPGNLQAGLDNQVPRGGNMGQRLLGYPFFEDSAMAAALTTGSKILTLGDFRYYIIVDRIGMNIELMAQVVGANRRPTGERGLIAWWRNSAKVLDANAFRVLVTG